ncbi:dimethyladenosine transferase 2, mitochondrial [Orussus abietinus]|uniref:dimethyladenosine transferase 2, mitochondrial n=1 Tax=Orussus abietinus TaxID=222816 RepID=UPI000625777E|nr:dimethyladenosine transferase 2, mitochondrial [Orussus abietinus]XP_012275674.1 dimethyladenosine transferase 2, mitochondrial [Orussus abietinus]XP_012275675.1 dimethyladenosine transferase 2, mitochondrial [Orussus abietinus]XP_012275676.1 dimethyladenosine transferase 2, mitochondrial [Orussus abietinus]
MAESKILTHVFIRIFSFGKILHSHRRSIIHYGFQTFSQSRQSEQVETQSEDDATEAAKDEQNAKRKSRRTEAEILQFFKSVNLTNVIQQCPEKYFKRARQSERLYLLDKATAKKMCDLIINDIPNEIPVLEANPGLGVLTKELLEGGVPTIHLYEPDTKFRENFQSLQKEYLDRIKIQNIDYFSLWHPKNNSNNVDIIEKAISHIPCKKYKEEPSMVLIGIIPNICTMRLILMSAILRNKIMSFGRTVFYIAVAPSIWWRMASDSSSSYHMYRSRSVMFQILFDYKVLGTISRKVVVPWPSINIKTRVKEMQELAEIEDQIMYIVKMEPKANFYEDFKEQNCLCLWYFLRHHLMARKNRIIPELEKWVPGCGPYLIAKGHDIFTEFGDLTPDKLLELYKTFVSWPESENTSFMLEMSDLKQGEEWATLYPKS